MCGIAGFFQANLSADDPVSVIQGMLRAIAHRGPDGTGYFIDETLAMGTTRLSILDAPSGTQPMSDPGGRYWLCYNGEIYNYQELRTELEDQGCLFRTRSDTEVVLHAWIRWGADALPRFNGGFAFAMYDRLRGELVLARDRYGKRPLCYVQTGRELLFASEMKAFLSFPGFAFRQDPDQLTSILGQWTPLPEQTGFCQVKSLPMASYLLVREHGAVLRHYEVLRLDAAEPIRNEPEATERIREVLDRSVALRLRSDVEVGVYLSGGVDSAIVALLAGKYGGHRLRTFSVEFEDTQFDESADQREVASYLNTRHHSVRIAHSDIADCFPRAIYHAEVPTFRSAFVPMYLLAQKTRAENIHVVMSGEGADEAFLGYDLFKETQLRLAWNTLPPEERGARLGRLYPHLTHYGPGETAALSGLYSQFAEENIPGLFSHELRFQNGRFSTRLMREAGDPFAEIAALVAAEPGYAAMTPTEKAQWLEFKTLLAGYLLSTQGERMSMAHGVENRCPFLDKAVVDLASSINLRFDDGTEEKRLLRHAFEGKLPAAILRKRKFPYRAPDSAAFADCRPDYLDMVLASSELAKLPFLDAKFARGLAHKVLTKPSEEISTKENQTFLFLLSIAWLHRLFVERAPEALDPAVTSPLVKAVDLRGVRKPVEGTQSSQGSLDSVV